MQPEWQPLVDAATVAVRRALDAAAVPSGATVGLYLRGSVPQGTAVATLSDLDLSLYLLAPAAESEANRNGTRAAARGWAMDAVEAELQRVRSDLAEKFLICSKVGAHGLLPRCLLSVLCVWVCVCVCVRLAMA